MFKKPIQTKKKHLIGNKDKKKIKAKLRTYYGEWSGFDVMFGSSTSISSAKINNPNFGVYTNDKDPLLLEEHPKSPLIPTVYGLQMMGDKVGTLLRINAGVEKFLFNGADLMWPGVSNTEELPPELKVDDIVGIMTAENEIIGSGKIHSLPKCDADSGSIKGRAVLIYNIVGDFLWRSGSQKILTPILNQQKEEEEKEEEEEKQLQAEKEEVQVDEQNTPQNQPQEEEKEITSEEVKKEETNNEQSKEVIQEELKEYNEEENKEVKSESPSQISKEQMNDLIKTAFLNSLKISVKKTDLPIEPSAFLNNHLFPCNPSQYFQLDLKTSSFTKIGNLLQQMAKQGIIEYKETKESKGHAVITAILEDSPILKEFTPTMKKPRKKKKETTTNVEPSEEDLKNLPYPRVSIVELYRPKKNISSLFDLDNKTNKNKYYTWEECKQVLFNYIRKEELVDPADPSFVYYDARLYHFFYGNQSDGPEGDYLKDVIKFFQEQLASFYQLQYLVDVGQKKDTKIMPSNSTLVEVVAEKSFNKKVTRISGLSIFLVDLVKLASDLKRMLSCSATIHQSKFQSGQEVMVQGNHCSKVMEVLVTNYKILPKFITIVDKLSNKKKPKGKGKK